MALPKDSSALGAGKPLRSSGGPKAPILLALVFVAGFFGALLGLTAVVAALDAQPVRLGEHVGVGASPGPALRVVDAMALRSHARHSAGDRRRLTGRARSSRIPAMATLER